MLNDARTVVNTFDDVGQTELALRDARGCRQLRLSEAVIDGYDYIEHVQCA